MSAGNVNAGQVNAGHVWLICREPVHIGGADSSNRGNNNPVFRLPDRSPAIPGSSLKGALREHAEQDYPNQVKQWFGGEDQFISPGGIALSWGWPVWWPVHVLGYGNWWVSCPAWLNRYQQLTNGSLLNLGNSVLVTDPALNNKTIFLRWLKLTQAKHYTEPLPVPPGVDPQRLIIMPDDSINVVVDMGLIRQPRVSLRDQPDDHGSLVKNLFAVEGFPPGAVFLVNWTSRGKVTNLTEWQTFLKGEHFLGGLWGVGYGRVEIL